MSRPYHVIIDPGHGGKDPGAVSRDKAVFEKDINLNVGLSMRSEVTSGDYLWTPLMTRDDDNFVTLKKRCEMANGVGADAFISLHCNARPRIGKPGIETEVYYYPGSQLGINFASIALHHLSRAFATLDIVYYSRGTKEGTYYILRKTKMPSILVEMGFLTDPEEAVILKRADVIQHIAVELSKAVEFYLEGGGI